MAYSIPVLPWQQVQWEQFSQYRENNHFPHAVLLTGSLGWGVSEFALRAAQILLCEAQHSNEPCGGCQQCQLFMTKQHPDFYLLQTEEGSKSIKIEAVRDLNTQIIQSPQIAHARVIVINLAENMTLGASNALLKLLEEPVPNTFFLLCTEQLNLLLATIRSRCQKINFTPAQPDVALPWLGNGAQANTWLSLTQGAPLLARTFLEDADFLKFYQQVMETFIEFLAQRDVLTTAKKMVEFSEKISFGLLIEWLKYYCRDLMLVSSTTEEVGLIHVDYASNCHKLVKNYSHQTWQSMYQCSLLAQHSYVKQPHLNLLLLSDTLFMELAAC